MVWCGTSATLKCEGHCTTHTTLNSLSLHRLAKLDLHTRKRAVEHTQTQTHTHTHTTHTQHTQHTHNTHSQTCCTPTPALPRTTHNDARPCSRNQSAPTAQHSMRSTDATQPPHHHHSHDAPRHDRNSGEDSDGYDSIHRQRQAEALTPPAAPTSPHPHARATPTVCAATWMGPLTTVIPVCSCNRFQRAPAVLSSGWWT